MQVVAMAFKG